MQRKHLLFFSASTGNFDLIFGYVAGIDGRKRPPLFRSCAINILEVISDLLTFQEIQNSFPGIAMAGESRLLPNRFSGEKPQFLRVAIFFSETRRDNLISRVP